MRAWLFCLAVVPLALMGQPGALRMGTYHSMLYGTGGSAGSLHLAPDGTGLKVVRDCTGADSNQVRWSFRHDTLTVVVLKGYVSLDGPLAVDSAPTVADGQVWIDMEAVAYLTELKLWVVQADSTVLYPSSSGRVDSLSGRQRFCFSTSVDDNSRLMFSWLENGSTRTTFWTWSPSDVRLAASGRYGLFHLTNRVREVYLRDGSGNLQKLRQEGRKWEVAPVLGYTPQQPSIPPAGR